MQQLSYQPMLFARALPKYDQYVYAPFLSGYRCRKLSTKPSFSKFVNSALSSFVNPADLVFVFGFAISKMYHVFETVTAKDISA